MPKTAAPPPAATSAARLTDRQFALIAGLAKREAGLAIPANKNAMVYSRVMKQMRAAGQTDLETYCAHLRQTKNPADLSRLVCALTTNVTQFFREPHHYRSLRDDVLPGLAKAARAGRAIRLWSAGCADGMEAYSIALVLAEAWPDYAQLDLRILATDIDSNVIARARAGRYAARHLAHIPPAYHRHLQRSPDGTQFDIAPGPKQLVTFNTLNLLRDWPMRHGFDAIFCRNVMIYFDEGTRTDLWPRLARAVQPGGWLFLGHSERLPKPVDYGFAPCGLTTYRKRPAAQ